MEGVHDMGGMHGFGAVPVDDLELPFDEPWEGRTFGLYIAAGVAGARSGSIRPGIEAIPPADYLAMSYFERWASSLERGLVDAGTLTEAEIDARVRDPRPPAQHGNDTNPELAAGLAAALVDRPRGPSGEDVAARFKVGDRVTVKRMAPEGHHRCPRYVRGVSGVVTRQPGGWPHASGDGRPEATYTVRFEMRDLWGDDAEAGLLHLDLWERYLT
ncbi:MULTISPECIES: nitrile hydratase subunit beta [unclassified Nocardioides]|uniref:nitrile hydratase subunit beta n=1 Tax=unclassified Nocardioides TaxID=2615069 RepID=UPI0012E3F9C0|nr:MULTISPECIES: nitrile hydratase subunit beta [unclassified Nocardioides]